MTALSKFDKLPWATPLLRRIVLPEAVRDPPVEPQSNRAAKKAANK